MYICLAFVLLVDRSDFVFLKTANKPKKCGQSLDLKHHNSSYSLISTIFIKTDFTMASTVTAPTCNEQDDLLLKANKLKG